MKYCWQCVENFEIHGLMLKNTLTSSRGRGIHVYTFNFNTIIFKNKLWWDYNKIDFVKDVILIDFMHECVRLYASVCVCLFWKMKSTLSGEWWSALFDPGCLTFKTRAFSACRHSTVRVVRSPDRVRWMAGQLPAENLFPPASLILQKKFPTLCVGVNSISD